MFFVDRRRQAERVSSVSVVDHLKEKRRKYESVKASPSDSIGVFGTVVFYGNSVKKTSILNEVIQLVGQVPQLSVRDIER